MKHSSDASDARRPRRAIVVSFTGLMTLLSPIPLFVQGAAPSADPVAPPSQTGTSASLKNLSLEDLMRVKVTTQSTVSRVDEQIDEAPGSVYVYPRSVIAERGYRSLGELLQTVPGFTVFHKDLQYVAGVRGLNANDNEKITLLINGQNLNNVNEPEFLNGPINLDNVERVEVVVGPSSFFQQANTLAATVNVITKNVDGVETIAATGSKLTYDTTLMAGHHWAPDQFLSFSFTTEAKRGFSAWDSDFAPNLAGKHLTGELDWPSFFGVLNGQCGELSGQIVAYRSTWPELLIDKGDPANNGVFTDQFYSVFLKDEHPWTDSLTSIAMFGVTLKEQTRLNDGGTPLNAVQLSIKQWNYTGELGLRYKGLANHVIQAGVQFSYDNNFDDWYTFNDRATGENIPKTELFSKDTSAVGFYIDDTIQATRWLKFVEGVRIDRNGRIAGDRWFPGARSAIIVEPTSFWISKAIFNRAVRMPSALAALNDVWGSNHLSTAPSFSQFSPQAQNPEILSTFELQNIFNFGSTRLGTTVYHQELENFITWESPHTNVGNFRGNGVELNLRTPIGEQVTFWANGSWNDSKLNLFRLPLKAGGGVETHHAYTNPEHHIIGSAKYTANAGLDCKIAEHWTFSPSLRYFTGQAALKFEANGYNLLANRKPVASQITADTYRPSGASVVFTVDLRF